MKEEIMRTKFIALLLGIVLSTFLSAGSLRGQAVWSTILGYVTDPSGAAVPGATVRVTNKLTGVANKVTTDSAGSYNITHLDPGAYDLVVEAKEGFKRFAQTGIQLAVNASVRVDAKLELGAVTQEITVAAHTAQLETQSTQVASGFNTHDLATLPLLGRNVTNMLNTVPGTLRDPVLWGTGDPSGSDHVYVNGTWSGSQIYVLDGISDVEYGFEGEQVVVPLLDSVQEMKVTTADYDAEFGSTAGMVAQYVTKSGTNQLHGSAYWSNRNKDTFAADPITEKIAGTGPKGKGIGVPPYNWNQGGFSLGGPIKKDKAFIFGAFEFDRYPTSSGLIGTIPNTAFQTGDFSALATTNPIYDPTTGNPDGTGRTQFSCPSHPGVDGPLNVICPDRISQVAKNLMALLPTPQSQAINNNYAGSPREDFNTYQFDTRADYNVREKDKVFARYSMLHSAATDNPLFGKVAGGPAGSYYASIATSREQQSAVNWTHTFSPNLIMEARAGFSRFRYDELGLDYALETDNAVGIPGINTGSPQTGGLAGFSIGGPTGSWGMGASGGFGIPRYDHTTNIEGVNNWTWMHGPHEFRFGVDVVREHADFLSNVNTRGSFNFSQGSTASADVPNSGLGQASFLLGDASSYSGGEAAAFPAERQTRWGAYAQDVWRVNRKLTVNLGLRWDKFTPIRPHFNGYIANFDPDTGDMLLGGLGSVPSSTGVYTPNTDFAPRVGIAYKVTNKTVLRAGLGRSYFESGYNATFATLCCQYPILTNQTISQTSEYSSIFPLSQGPPPPPTPEFPSTGMLPAPNNVGLFYRPNNWRTETQDSWNFTIERQLSPNTLLDVAYVGAKGTDLSWDEFINEAPPGPGDLQSRRPYYILYGLSQNIQEECNCVSSNYNSLQIDVRRTYSRWLTFTSNLVWQKYMGYMSDDPVNRKVDYGPGGASYDIMGSWAYGGIDRALVWNLAHTFMLPYGPGMHWGPNATGIKKAVLAGWQFSSIENVSTGLAMTPWLNNTTQLNSDWTPRAQVVPGCNPANVPGGRNRNDWYNQACFTLPPPYTYGDAAVGSMRGPGAINADFSLAKQFAFSSPLNREKTAIEVRATAYNVFNFTNLGDPSQHVDGAEANVITYVNPAYPMRRFEFGVHMAW
jgi:hypothetical protein